MHLSDAPLYLNIPAHDIERAMSWYQEKLGVTPALDAGNGGQLYRTGGVFWLIYQTPSAGTGRHTLGTWVVPDIDETMRELRSKGVVFEDYDMGDQGPTTVDGVARGDDGGAAAWFTDSEGNILSVTQLPPTMALPGDVT